jgi:tetratricopeptide (TPR) repeat protein
MANLGQIQRNRSALSRGAVFGKPRRRLIVSPVFLTVWTVLMIGAALSIRNADNITARIEASINTPGAPTLTPIQYARQGDTAFWKGDLNAAVDNYRLAAQIDPTDVGVLYELIRVLIYRSYGDVRNLGDIDEAEQWAIKAVEASPDDPRANAINCFALVRAGKTSNAIQSCLRAIDLDDSFADAHAFLSMASYDLGRTSQASEQAETAVRLNENSIDANIAFARTLSFAGRNGAALTHYEKAASINPNLEFPFFEMGFFAYNLANRNNGDESRYRIAINAYETVIKRNPNSVKAYTRLCQTQLARGEPKLARQYCMKATEVDPGYTLGWRWLGEVYHKSRNYEDAVQAFAECQRQEIALGIPKENRTETCWWLQGVDYFILGDCDKARPILEDVLSWTRDEIAVRESNRTLLKCATAYEGTYQTPTPVPSPTPRPTPIL